MTDDPDTRNPYVAAAEELIANNTAGVGVEDVIRMSGLLRGISAALERLGMRAVPSTMLIVSGEPAPPVPDDASSIGTAELAIELSDAVELAGRLIRASYAVASAMGTRCVVLVDGRVAEFSRDTIAARTIAALRAVEVDRQGGPP